MRLFRKMQQAGQMAKLSAGQTYFRTTLENLGSLFNSTPFPVDAWSAAERCPDLKIPGKYGGRDASLWTPRALRAWQYVDRFLTIKGLCPMFELPQTDADPGR
jgi:hypothetical protein